MAWTRQTVLSANASTGAATQHNRRGHYISRVSAAARKARTQIVSMCACRANCPIDTSVKGSVLTADTAAADVSTKDTAHGQRLRPSFAHTDGATDAGPNQTRPY
ncbi:hypothetical protein NN3_00130 [Nocardia neocaledoniensis NBRC 108232]|nr:hypothetical protein NN3_00130 [Nocardia neocaledoniensis NBRC 108232]